MKRKKASRAVQPLSTKLLDVFQGEERISNIIIRGSRGKVESEFDDWSDFDLTIVTEAVDARIMNIARKGYKSLCKRLGSKVSLTVVSMQDFKSRLHHHGIKPIYYSEEVRGDFLAKGRRVAGVGGLPRKMMRLDCFSNASYLIHDLRNRYLALDNGMDGLREFAIHCAKRLKHFVRNCIFSITGRASPSILKPHYDRLFGDLGLDIEGSIARFKENWERRQNNRRHLKAFVEFALMSSELIYLRTQSLLSRKS